MTDPYVFVRLKHPVNKQLEFTGTLTLNEDDTAAIEYRNKAARKTAVFDLDEIEYIRLAVKF